MKMGYKIISCLHENVFKDAEDFLSIEKIPCGELENISDKNGRSFKKEKNHSS